MVNPLLRHVGDSVLKLAPYQPGRLIEEVAAERGIADVIKLASNENPLGPAPAALRTLQGLAATALSRYPDGQCSALRQALAKRLQVSEENIIIGNGSNEILELAAQLLLTENTQAIYSQHAFVVYELATAARRAQGIVVPADENYGHDLMAIARRANDEKTRLIFIANPNNPTGTWHPRQKIIEFMAQIPPHVLVLLDEAYREYIDGEDALTTPMFPNLITTRTFSKIYGLAGLRIGYGIGAPEIIDLLHRIRQPFNVNAGAQAAALAALEDVDYVTKCARMNDAGRRQIAYVLDDLNISYMPSWANFITFKPPLDAAQAYENFLANGVIVRPLASYELPQWLRVSIGTEAENNKFLSLLKNMAA